MKKFLLRLWYKIGRTICKWICYPFFGMQCCDTENIPDHGPVLILSNHQSFLDPIFCQSSVKRNLCFVARDSLFDIKLLSKLMHSLGVIPIKRDKADISAMKTLINILKQEKAICLFPEATRTSNGKIAEIKPGFGLLSRRTGASIVPMVIDGAFECWPRHKKFPSPGKVTISCGKAITTEKIKELGDKEFAKVLTETLRQMQNQQRIKAGKEPYDYC